MDNICNRTIDGFPLIRKYPIQTDVDRYAILDEETHDWLTKNKAKLYLRDGEKRPTVSIRKSRKRITIKLARAVTRCPKGSFVKHLNYDEMDCRRENLEIVGSQFETKKPLREYSQEELLNLEA
jgi:hypothetical protein